LTLTKRIDILDSSPIPQNSAHSTKLTTNQRIRYFIEDYWDIFFGVISGVLAYKLHIEGSYALSAFASAMAIIFFSITVSEIAEILADRLKEPLGSFVLTFSAVVVEILLLFMVLLERSDGLSSMAADTVKGGIISAVIVDMNLLLGLSVLVGGLAYKMQEHNEETSGSYITILLVTACVLLVPSILALTNHNAKVLNKASVLVAILLFAYYIVILIFQTKTHINFFKATARSRLLRFKKRMQDRENGEEEEEEIDHYIFERMPTAVNFLFMTGFILIIGLLAEFLAMDGLKTSVNLGISPAVAGLIIAFIAVAPEFFTAIRAARNDEPQRVINIAMGASTVTILVTVPMLLLLAKLYNIELPLNFNTLEIGALIFTVLLAWKTTQNGITDYLEGISHLVFFFAYMLLAAYF
jgi:Ca2+:H+ antiporter